VSLTVRNFLFFSALVNIVNYLSDNFFGNNELMVLESVLTVRGFAEPRC